MIVDKITGERVSCHRPWPRVIVSAAEWRHASEALQAGKWTLLSLWGETRAVHMAVLDVGAGPATANVNVLTFECKDGTFPSVGALHPCPHRRCRPGLASRHQSNY